MRKYIINDRAYLEHELIALANERLQVAPEWECKHWRVILKWLSNPAFIEAKTSGSTGTPKIMRHSGRAVRASAMITSDYFDLREGSSAFLCLPSTFIGGKMMILRALIHGWQLDWCEPSSFPFEHVKKHYDFTAITPHQCAMALSHGYNFKLFKHVLLGGAAVDSKTRHQLIQTPGRFYLGYAMTETLTHIAMQKISNDDDPTVFHCLGRTTVSLDQRGCLEIHAPHLDTPHIITNDMGELIDEKTFRLLGRLDHVINSGGVKIMPHEIELKLEDLIDSPFYITKMADALLGEKVALKIEGQPWSQDQLHELSARMHAVLSPYQMPKEIIFESAFEKTENQKIIKR